jgi:hypothetical protein
MEKNVIAAQFKSKTFAAIYDQKYFGEKDWETLHSHIKDDYVGDTMQILDKICTPAQILKMTQKGKIKMVRHARWIASSGHQTNSRGYILDNAIGLGSLAVAMSAQKSFDYNQIRAILGGSQEGTEAVQGVSRQKLHLNLSAFLRKNPGTLGAQTSRTFGTSGIFQELGITEKIGENRVSVKNRNHPLIVLTVDVLEGFAETTFVDMLSKSKD